MTAANRPASFRPSADGSVLLGEGDGLSAAQTLRVAVAVAVLKAKKKALRSGMSDVELHMHSWVVDVQPDDAGLAQRVAAVLDGQVGVL